MGWPHIGRAKQRLARHASRDIEDHAGVCEHIPFLTAWQRPYSPWSRDRNSPGTAAVVTVTAEARACVVHHALRLVGPAERDLERLRESAKDRPAA